MKGEVYAPRRERAVFCRRRLGAKRNPEALQPRSPIYLTKVVPFLLSGNAQNGNPVMQSGKFEE